ncbi:MAG: NADH-quinone oxidoreductase subunit NuoE [Clostridia bacterium]|nr:NADH-quinone oxidoreductase subunit NuoE [Clostridia bacterium]MDE6790767.1 NADH-quinone oxidoreductase subunit NuoE [Clostridia bacterium]MDE7400986.1 NADH-quinone oxidoreductase subunit NuoE [Clostridia bacterium]
MSQTNFNGTGEQEKALRECIAKHKSERGCLMPILHEAQEIYGYLPAEVQQVIAEELNIPLSEVYGVATFYTQFSLQPKGKHRISVCLGTACYVKGSDKILAAVERELRISCGECTPDGRFSIDSCRCVGACGLAPVMIVDDDVYGRLTEKDVPEILEKYMQD